MADVCPLQDTTNCTIATCPLSCAQVGYVPTLPGNAVYAAAFGALLIAQLLLGIRSRTWGFMVGMICGLILELVGYAGRIMLHDDPFSFNSFIIYLVCLTIGPAFLSGALYLCLSRIIVTYNQRISKFSPRSYAIVFMTSDFISLVLQGAGGGLAATADTTEDSNTGRSVMVAGLVFQVVSLLVFMSLCAEFKFRIRKTGKSAMDARFVVLRASKKFAWFQVALATAVVLIFIRSVYRVAELQQGFNGPIADNEIAFMILEGPMIFLAVLAMTMLHPGVALGEDWLRASWSLSGKREAVFATGGSSSEDVHLQEDMPKY